MKKLLTVLGLAGALLSLSSVAFADNDQHTSSDTNAWIQASTSDDHGNGHQGFGNGIVNRVQGALDGRDGTSTFDHRPASTSPMQHPVLRSMGGIEGVVSGIDSDSFMLDIRGAHGATTTITVAISSSTVFKEATTTGSFADLAIGTNVHVNGAYATSTKTITAMSVAFDGAMQNMKMGGGENHPKLADRIASFFEGWFNNGSTTASTTASTSPWANASGTPPNVPGNGILQRVINILFGWMQKQQGDN